MYVYVYTYKTGKFPVKHHTQLKKKLRNYKSNFILSFIIIHLFCTVELCILFCWKQCKSCYQFEIKDEGSVNVCRFLFFFLKKKNNNK